MSPGRAPGRNVSPRAGGSARRWIAVALAALFSVGPVSLAADTSTVRVATAISLKPAIEEIASSYRDQHPGTTVEIHAGGSNLIVQQLLRGAPADLVLTAGSIEMERLERGDRLVADSRRPFASNRLVVVLPPSGYRMSIVQDLVRPEFELVAVANPRTAPLGRYTDQAIKGLDLDGELALRLVRAGNARQTLEYVTRGEVDAGIVYRSDAWNQGQRLRIGPEFPKSSHSPIVYEAAVLADAKEPEAAARFLQALLSPAGRRILENRGFPAP